MSLKIGVIVSTTRPTSVGRKVADWFITKVQDVDASFEIIDLKEEDLPFLAEPKSPASGEYELESTKKWSQKISGYDGFVFVTAEYNHGPPAPLKNALDTLFNEWDKKPVAFVGYGTVGAARAIEQLVTIIAKIGMVPLSKSVVAIIKSWDAVKPDGTVDESLVLGDPKKVAETLVWWSEQVKK